MAGPRQPLAPDDVRGRQMGNYEVLCRLSTGGMAEIFLASKRGLAGFHKPVVLKKILPDIQGQEEFVRMFLDEAKVTAAFNHPHIAQVFDLDVAQGELFLAMEFVPGATLLEVARACRAADEPMPIGFGLASVRDTALALHYAHTFTDALGQPSPVIHRDVAEKNIMVTYEGVTKLLDFGIAKNLAGAHRTQVGMVKGTNGYMSPEQILGEPLDARSDLFSLGVVLHECLTGMRLFPGKVPSAVWNAVLKGPIAEPSRTNKAIPPELDAIVLKALARRREDRYASALEFARELERAVGPLIWLPERSGELLRRLFAERREQTRQLLASGRAAAGGTGEVKLAQLFSDRETPSTPPPVPATPPAPSPGVAAPRARPPLAPTPPPGVAAPPRISTAGLIPVISAPNFPVPAAASDHTDVVPYPAVTKSPAPAPNEVTRIAAPPPPPAPAPPEETPGPNRPVLPAPRAPARASGRQPPPPEPRTPAPPEPSPARPRGPNRTDAPPAVKEPVEPDLKTAVMRPRRPSDQPVTPDPGAASGGGSARVPRRPSLSHLDAVTQPARSLEPSLSHLDAVTQPVRSLEQPGTSAPEQPSPPVSRPPLPPPRKLELDDEDAPEYPTVPALRLPTTPAKLRPMGFEDDEDAPEYPTVPVLKSPLPPWSAPVEPQHEEHEERTSPNGLVIESQEKELAASSPPAPEPTSSRRGVLVATLVLAILLGAGAAMVALRLDGGLLSSRLFPQDPAQARTQAAEAPPPPASTAAPASTGDAAPVVPQTGTGDTPPADPAAQAAPSSATPEATATSAAPATPEEAAAGAGAAEGQNEAVPTDAPPPPGASATDGQDDAPEAAAQVESPEPAQSAKRGKVAAPSRRKRASSADVESAPEQVTNANEADRAWEAMERERTGAAETSGETGSLTLTSDQYAKVYLGNRLLGETPLFRVSLPSGKHTLKLVGPDGKSQKVSVEIKPKELSSLRVSLGKQARE
ncbi:protein kinase [Archangium violaceum]|uniref:serine/threonine-protein kinase n=1 Tax=Archangium violaceum TaxID=83451 RepID=UPI00194FA086|nr:serine/threonine-protein kinase [Archangium violaceum]QRN97397.1 protein kinase [Archangium violaceum]